MDISAINSLLTFAAGFGFGVLGASMIARSKFAVLQEEARDLGDSLDRALTTLHREVRSRMTLEAALPVAKPKKTTNKTTTPKP